MVLLLEKSREFQLPIWACALDFKKAFDTIEHGALWEAMLNHNVPALYVRVLASLYSNQVGKIKGRAISKTFPISRGTKQGDPLSPTLFNSVLEFTLKPLIARWRRNGWGLRVGEGTDGLLCTLRFADDILLLASTRYQLRHMLGDIVQVIRTVGLEIHAGKSKVLHNEFAATGSTHQVLNIHGHSFDILPANEGTSYLGRLLCFGDAHEAELDHRIALAWKKFFMFKKELCNRRICIGSRLRLFQSVISATALYSAGTWTLTAERERKLRTTQRKMLRSIVQVGRQTGHDNTEVESCQSSNSDESTENETEADDEIENDLEPWVEWVKRATSLSQDLASKHGICDWVEEHRRRMWTLAGHTVRRDDRRWSTQLVHWIPSTGGRKVGHPAKRWLDELVAFHELIFD
eukprot:12404857-Karenia_brevis.AAC.1